MTLQYLTKGDSGSVIAIANIYILRCYFHVDPAAAYLTSTWVFPIPSPTGIAFKDLKWNHTRDQVWNGMETG